MSINMQFVMRTNHYCLYISLIACSKLYVFKTENEANICRQLILEFRRRLFLFIIFYCVSIICQACDENLADMVQNWEDFDHYQTDLLTLGTFVFFLGIILSDPRFSDDFNRRVTCFEKKSRTSNARLFYLFMPCLDLSRHMISANNFKNLFTREIALSKLFVNSKTCQFH